MAGVVKVVVKGRKVGVGKHPNRHKITTQGNQNKPTHKYKKG